MRTLLSHGAAALLALALTIATSAQTSAPLPLDVIVSLKSHNGRSPVDLSPDGEWVAHTYGREDRVPRQTRLFGTTGFPFAEGDARMQAALTNVRTGEVIRLGGEKGASWGAVWSPDGQRVAYFSDDSGEVGLWIWEKAARKAERFPGVTARPFFGFELVRWAADSQRLLCKILPVGMTVAEANALVPDPETPRRFGPVAPGQPSVFVLRANMDDAAAKAAPPPRMAGNDRELADLAILDVRSKRVIARAERSRSTWYAWSPDGKAIAFTDHKGWEANTQQPNYDLVIWTPASGERRVLIERMRSGYGIDLNWAPDGRRLAYVASGRMGKGELHVVGVTNDVPQRVTARGVPSFELGEGERPPLWSTAGDSIYAIGTDAKLWRVDASSGEGRVIGDLAGHPLRMLVSQPDRSTVWSPDRERSLWAIGRHRDADEMGFYRIDVAARAVHRVFTEKKVYSTAFNVDVSDATREIVFVARDQRHPPDVWRFDPATSTTHQVTRLNDHLEKYELGVTRVMEWRGSDGRPLRGALLLPPGYQDKQRLPLVVWVYAGDTGSSNVNTFGLTGHGSTFNMQVLATRGYAVLYPDAPIAAGRISADLMNAVMPALDAAIDQGYADPERLAVMGQSFGALNVLSLISQTTRFKAAVITASVLHPDLFSAYTDMAPDGSAANAGYFEQGQGNMGGTPWQVPERYRENSPLFAFDRIETPLLIGQGEKDGTLLGANAVFVALQRLGKKVEYRLYEGEGHVITRKANVVDFWNRRLQFLDEHLGVRR